METNKKKTKKQMYGFQEQEKHVRQLGIIEILDFRDCCYELNQLILLRMEKQSLSNVYPPRFSDLFSAQVHSVFYTLHMSLLTIVKQQKISQNLFPLNML